MIGNTADDITLFGLRVCPDLDTLMYTLGGGVDEAQGWGRAEETFRLQAELAAYRVEPQWFALGDLDLATHVVRTQMLGSGFPLSQVQAALGTRWLPEDLTLLPMTDERVETHVVLAEDDAERRAVHFQEWWVRLRAEPPAERIVLVGLEDARPAPGVLESLTTADLVVLPPSNPVVSLGPVLSVPGLREQLRDTVAPVVGLSPIIGGRPVRGMADACLRAIGVASTATAVAGLFADVLDGWLVDSSDAAELAAIEALGITVRAVPLLMHDEAATVEMAAQTLALAESMSEPPRTGGR